MISLPALSRTPDIDWSAWYPDPAAGRRGRADRLAERAAELSTLTEQLLVLALDAAKRISEQHSTQARARLSAFRTLMSSDQWQQSGSQLWDYLQDASQRAVLFLDAMRQAGNQKLEQHQEGQDRRPVLIYDYDIVSTGGRCRARRRTHANRAVGLAETVGNERRIRVRDGAGETMHEERWEDGAAFHAESLQRILRWRQRQFPAANVVAAGHRVVHGGVDFGQPVLVTDAVLEKLRALIPLAPLHQPHNIAGILAAREAWPHVACFDTAFHRQHPFVNDTFALPRRFYAEGVRRYGFHGLSYEYITGKLREIAPLHASGRVVVAHLGNGASMCAIRDGLSVASSMGFTALDGLPMGTRCGQLAAKPRATPSFPRNRERHRRGRPRSRVSTACSDQLPGEA